MSAATDSSPTPATFWPVIGFAALAGMRSAGAPTLLSHYLVRHPAPALASSPLRLLQQPAVAVAFKLAAAREFIHDKQPNGAPRTAPRGLSLRTIGGALAGATWFKANGQSALRGALLGGFGAAAATFGWYQLRKAITEKAALPPNAVGFGEDALLWSAGAVLLHNLLPPAPQGPAQPRCIAPAANRASTLARQFMVYANSGKGGRLRALATATPRCVG